MMTSINLSEAIRAAGFTVSEVKKDLQFQQILSLISAKTGSSMKFFLEADPNGDIWCPSPVFEIAAMLFPKLRAKQTIEIHPQLNLVNVPKTVPNAPEVSVFDFSDHPVRVVDRAGVPWFIATDVCRVLDLSNITESTKTLESDELDSVILNSGQQGRRMVLVSESGLYALIFKSRKPQAKAFRKWVTSEVLPAIRQTGRYETPQVNANQRLASSERNVDRLLDINGALIEEIAETRRILWNSKRSRLTA